MIWNLVGVVTWTGGIGFGAYYFGPAVVDVVNDSGWLSVIGIALLVTAGVTLEVGRRRRAGMR
jgi:membrane protein DedA with SNARE-associated domain